MFQLTRRTKEVFHLHGHLIRFKLEVLTDVKEIGMFIKSCCSEVFVKKIGCE